MSSQSERIRAVLARSDTARSMLEPVVEPAPAIAVNTDNLEALLRSEAPPMEPAPREAETFLPLIATPMEARAEVQPVISNVDVAAPIAPPREKRTSWVLPAVLASAAILVLGGVGVFFMMKDRWFPAPVAATVTPAPNKPSFPLQVKAEAQGNGSIDVRWNPQSDLLSQARSGRLVITEGDREPRVLDLTPDQLKIGHLAYQSLAERIEFRLEVVDGAGSTVEESVMAVSSGKAAPEAPGQVIPAASSAEPPQPNRPQPRAFTPPSQPKPELTAVTIDPPSAAVPAGAVAVPGGDVRQTMSNLSAPPMKQATPPPQPASPQVRVGGKVQMPVILKKIPPIYPALARERHIQGDVRFTATIDKAGKVQNLKLVSGQAALVQAATEAVRQWVYRPSILNGEPTESTTEINVNFTLGQ